MLEYAVSLLPENLLDKDVRVGSAQTGFINDDTPYVGVFGLGSCFNRMLGIVCTRTADIGSLPVTEQNRTELDPSTSA